MKLIKEIEKQKSTWFLLISASVFFLLRLPSLFEPYWYGDEGIYETIGMAINRGRHLYSGIWDNKPPLLYYIYAIFNGDQSSVRFISLIFGLLSVFGFFFLAKKLFKNQSAQFVSTGIFAFLFATPFLEGNIANAENFMLLPIIIASLWIYTSKKNNNSQNLLLSTNSFVLYAGILLGMAFLIKVVAVFDFGAFFIFLFITTYKGFSSLKTQLKRLIIFTSGFLLPIFLTLLFYFVQGNLKLFITSAFLSNVGYVSYGNNSVFPHGFLVLKLITLLLFALIIFFKRKNIQTETQFILLWTAFSLFNAFFSQRPYTHYLLTIISSFALLTGLCVNSKLRKVWIILCILLILVINRGFDLRSRIGHHLYGYYWNFLSFVTQKESTSQYYTFFDSVTLRDKELATYLNMRKRINDSLFIWGDSAQIYKMSNMLPPGRFTVAYHITQSGANLYETGSDLKRVKPHFIILMPNQANFPFTLTEYQPKLSIRNAVIYEKVF